jgi:hypothetical protein
MVIMDGAPVIVGLSPADIRDGVTARG